jgi:hypothetical protein
MVKRHPFAAPCFAAQTKLSPCPNFVPLRVRGKSLSPSESAHTRNSFRIRTYAKGRGEGPERLTRILKYLPQGAVHVVPLGTLPQPTSRSPAGLRAKSISAWCMPTTSGVAKGAHRVYFCRAPRRNVGGKHGDTRQNHGDTQKRQRIRRPHAVQEAGH